MKILSLDGGGIRGVLTTTILERLEAFQPVVARADVIAGTSTGGIIALGLAAGISPAELTGLYRDHGHEIFDSTWMRDVSDVGGINGAKYDNVKLRALLESKFGFKTLGDLTKKVVIPTFNLHSAAPGCPDYWGPRFMNNMGIKDDEKPLMLIAAALRTSAAPTFFPSAGSFIDGGVIANDPSMVAVAAAIEAGARLEDISVLSIGTGRVFTFVPGEDHDWGDRQWVQPLIGLLLDANVGVADRQCAQFLGERYRRENPPLRDAIQLDAWSRVPDLVTVARGLNLDATSAWLARNWK